MNPLSYLRLILLPFIFISCSKSPSIQKGSCYLVQSYGKVKILEVYVDGNVGLQWFENGKLITKFGLIFWNKGELLRRGKEVDCGKRKSCKFDKILGDFNRSPICSDPGET